MSSPRRLLLAALEPWDSGDFDYLLYGGLAAALWGEPATPKTSTSSSSSRTPNPTNSSGRRRKHGFAIEEDLAIQQDPGQRLGTASLRRPQEPVAPGPDPGDSPFDKSASPDEAARLFDRNVWVASPEDLLIYKLVSWRDRDVMDVHAIVARQKLSTWPISEMVTWWVKQGSGSRHPLRELGLAK